MAGRPSEKTVVLHIGPHKTGSTSLQAALRSNRDALEASGVLYPATGTGKTAARIHGQHNLAWELLENYRHRPELGDWNDLRAEIDGSQCSHVFVSSEAFSQLNVGAVERIKAELAAYNIQIVYIARRHTDIIRSVYSQFGVSWNVLSAADFHRKFAERGISSPFDNIGKRNGSDEPAIRTFLHRPKLEAWINTFGPDAVQIIIPDDLGNYLGNIAVATGLPALPEIEIRRLNSARSLAHIGLVTSVCRSLQGMITPREFNVELAPYISSLYAGAAASMPRPKGLPDEVVTLIEPHVSEDIAWLEQYAAVPDYWKEIGGSEGFTEPDIPSTEIGRLLASDYLQRRIEVLDQAMQNREDEQARNTVRQRKERLEEVLNNLLAA